LVRRQAKVARHQIILRLDVGKQLILLASELGCSGFEASTYLTRMTAFHSRHHHGISYLPTPGSTDVVFAEAVATPVVLEGTAVACATMEISTIQHVATVLQKISQRSQSRFHGHQNLYRHQNRRWRGLSGHHLARLGGHYVDQCDGRYERPNYRQLRGHRRPSRGFHPDFHVSENAGTGEHLGIKA